MILVNFIVAIVFSLIVIYLIIKLIDKWQLKKLKKKYPEGAVTKSIKVGSLEEVPTETLKPAVNKELLDKLKLD